MANKVTVYSFYKELPAWAKGVVVVGGVAILYFTTRSILKRIRKNADLQQARETVRTQDQEMRNLERSGVKQTYAGSQYKSWADQIQKQFDGCDGSLKIPFVNPEWLGNTMWSNSGSYVANVFMQLKNDVDFLALMKAYGVRTFDQCGYFTGDFTGNLQQSITDELDQSEISALNRILSRNKITYKI